MKLIQYYRKMQVMPTLRKVARKYIIMRELDRQLKKQLLDVDEDELIKQSLNSVELTDKELSVFEKRISELIKEIEKTKGE